jgi:hypothetical protein
MKHSIRRLLIGGYVALALPSTSWAIIIGTPNSNVDAYFGSQSDAYQNSNPAAGSWPASPILLSPPPPTAYALTSVPGTSPNPNVTPSNVTPFAPTASFSGFNDGVGNTATSAIVGFIGTTGTMDDAQINLQMTVNQGASSPGYAYEQLNYSIDYSLANTPNTAGFLSGLFTSAVTRSFSVTGSVGSWVYFGGQMDFWDVPTSGPAVNMGTLVFNFLNVAAGPFATVVSGTGTIGPGNVAWGIDAPDTLRVTGTFLLAGDPSSISVNSIEPVPVPAGMWLFGSAVALLGVVRRRAIG